MYSFLPQSINTSLQYAANELTLEHRFEASLQAANVVMLNFALVSCHERAPEVGRTLSYERVARLVCLLASCLQSR